MVTLLDQSPVIAIPFLICACLLTSVVKFKSFFLVANYNTFLHVALWMIGVVSYVKTSSIMLLLIPLHVFVINEFMYLLLNYDIYSSRYRTKLFYDISTLNFIGKHKNSTNFTEAIFLNNDGSTMTINQAKVLCPKYTNNVRFEKVLELLGIQHNSGAWILDLGCGNGDFIKYCASVGINVVGLTISTEQKNVLIKEGYEVHIGDYVEYHNQFSTRFDAITALGSLEHIHSGNHAKYSSYVESEKIKKRFFSNLATYLNPGSECKKVYLSALHFNPLFTNAYQTYILERAFGAYCFPTIKGMRLYDNVPQFDLVYDSDMTEHYWLSTVVDRKHFGNPGCFNMDYALGILAGIFINPFILQMLAYPLIGTWMWMFDGKNHYYGENEKQMTLVKCSNMRPASLFWAVLQLNDKK